MIVLLLSVAAAQFRNYRVRQSNFITKCDRLLLQSESGI